MTRKEAMRQSRQLEVLQSLGFTQEEGEQLRRISTRRENMTATKQAATSRERESHTENRYFVYESLYSNVCRAAQPTFYGALQYMAPGRVIVTEPRT